MLEILICGVIKQNQSEVSQIQFPVFFLIVCIIFTATFCRNPIKIGQLVPKIRAVKGCKKTKGNKRHFLLCLALF